MSALFRGVFTIPSTPFDERFKVDEPGLRRIVDFCVGCGAHGLVYPVNASAFTSLSDEERMTASQVVVEQCAGRVPVVVGVAGVCAEHAAMFARHARRIGADAVIAMTPYVNKLHDESLVLAYYRALAQAAGLPVFIQNHPVGSELPVATLARLVQQVDRVEYIKEETSLPTHKLTQVLAQAGPRLKGVFGGAGGRYLLLEHPRGVAGQMPGCHVTDVVVRLWDELEAGDAEAAGSTYGRLAPLFALEALYPGAVYKEVLRRRGVIGSARGRGVPDDSLDEADHQALDRILADLEPLFTWRADRRA